MIIVGRATDFNNKIIRDVRDVKNVCDKIIGCVLFFRIRMTMHILVELGHKGFDLLTVFESIHTLAKRVIGGPKIWLTANNTFFSLRKPPPNLLPVIN